MRAAIIDLFANGASGVSKYRVRRRARAMTILSVAGLAGFGVAPGCEPQSQIPTQWIGKQYTELLGRAPTDSEWTSWLNHYAAISHCNFTDTTALTRQLATSAEFTGDYPGSSPLTKAERVTALIRAVFSRDPTTSDWNTYYVPYRKGTLNWEQVVSATLDDGSFQQNMLPSVCGQDMANYGFRDMEIPLDLQTLTGGRPSRTQQQLQATLDAAAPGSTIRLQPGELVLIGGSNNNNQGLHIKAGVTLSTVGSPSPHSYAKMGRLAPAGPDALICDGAICNNSALVKLDPGAAIANVWISGHGLWNSGASEPRNFKIANVETWGSTVSAPTQIVANRVSDPGRDGTAIRAYGFSLTGAACSNEQISQNLITGYSSLHQLDRFGQSQWVDGIAVHCESATVQQNEIVDVTDAGIMLYGSYNRELATAATQQSQVMNNRILSAGLSAKVALGADPIGVCRAIKDLRSPGPIGPNTQTDLDSVILQWFPCPPFDQNNPTCSGTCRVRSATECLPWTWAEFVNSFPACGAGPTTECAYLDQGAIIPCLDIAAERSFTGAVVDSNLFASNPRTHFDIGLMIGGSPRWGEHQVLGRGATFTNNTTGGAGAQVNTGISVTGMFDVTLTGNAASYTVADTNPDAGWLKCPQENVVVASSAYASVEAGAQSYVQSDAAYGCMTDEPSPSWLYPIVASTDGATLAQDANGDGVGDQRFHPWGFNFSPPLPPTSGEPFDFNLFIRDTRDMRRMGGNVVRVGPTIRWILNPPTDGFPYGTPNRTALDWFRNILSAAEQAGMYVDVTPFWNQPSATPDWYDQATEDVRWGAQALWWTLVAGVGKDRTAIAWYDLVNEPLLPGPCSCDPQHTCQSGQAPPDCCDPNNTGATPNFRICPTATAWRPDPNDPFNEYLVLTRLDSTGHERTATEIVRAWMSRMRSAIRVDGGDTSHLISIGTMGFTGVPPSDVADLEELTLEHSYPTDDTPNVFFPGWDEFQNNLASSQPYDIGKPHIVEEAFVLSGTQLALEGFMRQQTSHISGWITHYVEDKSPVQVAAVDSGGGFAASMTYAIMMRNVAAMSPNGTGAMQP